jgi:DNA-binding NarL/FixJ family response regulator
MKIMNEQQILLESEQHAGVIGHKGDTLLESALVFSADNAIDLTRRESEILRLIVSGQTNKEIAKRLSRSERTVEFHRNRLMRKMAAHNAAELVRQAIGLGIV